MIVRHAGQLAGLHATEAEHSYVSGSCNYNIYKKSETASSDVIIDNLPLNMMVLGINLMSSSTT